MTQHEVERKAHGILAEFWRVEEQYYCGRCGGWGYDYSGKTYQKIVCPDCEGSGFQPGVDDREIYMGQIRVLMKALQENREGG